MPLDRQDEPPRSLPSGELTFLFSDIEGSTLRWERNRATMREAVALHDRIMHAVVSAHHGYVFKTLGDQFCSVFEKATDAVAAALAAQEQLALHDWSAIDGLHVRMALHSGVADERGGDYYGPTVTRVARLTAIGFGGQVLVSRATAALLNGRLRDGVGLKDLGEHRLGDLAERERVFQLQAPHLAPDFPRLKSLADFETNLTKPIGTFVGRRDDVATIADLLDGVRILTLVGAAGIGKTRIALEVAGGMLATFPDGVWHVDFANVADATLVEPAIGEALGIAPTPGHPAFDAVEAYLRDRRALLVFDNCGRLLTEIARITEALTRACPRVAILATSREPLKVDGEYIHYVSPLELPQAGVTAETALRSSAVALFVDRVKAVNPAFELTDENVDAVVEICRKLDGIALAIEVIAPRTKVLSLEAIASRLSERLSVVAGGRRTAPLRHQTLRALFDSSYDTLTDEERSVFRRLGVFVDGASLEAVEAVCADIALGDNAVSGVLSTLVEKSLLVAEIGARTQRYHLPASLQEYALERLDEAEERALAAARHAGYFLARAQRAEAAHDGKTPTDEWLAPLALELDNFWAALTWCLAQHNDDEVGQRIVAALRSFWIERDAAGGWYWAELALGSLGAGADPLLRAKLLSCQAALAIVMGRRAQAYEQAREAACIARERGDDGVLLQALRIAGASLLFLASPYDKEKLDESQALLEEARRMAHDLGNRHEDALAAQALGGVLRLRGNLSEAVRVYEQALTLAQRCADERATVITLGNLADATFEAGDAAAALAYNAAALTLTEDRRDAVARTHLLLNRSAYLIALERFGEAGDVAERALELARDKQSPILIAGAVEHLATIAAWRGQLSRSARLLGFADSRYAALRQRREYTERREREWTLDVLRDRLSPAELETHMRQGSALSEDRAIAEALASIHRVRGREAGGRENRSAAET